MLNKYEKKIIIALRDHRRPMTVNEIAKEAGISWMTCRKYAKALGERELVEIFKWSGFSNHWKVNLIIPNLYLKEESH